MAGACSCSFHGGFHRSAPRGERFPHFPVVFTSKAWIYLEDLWGEACPPHLRFLNNTCGLISEFPDASLLVNSEEVPVTIPIAPGGAWYNHVLTPPKWFLRYFDLHFSILCPWSSVIDLEYTRRRSEAFHTFAVSFDLSVLLGRSSLEGTITRHVLKHMILPSAVVFKGPRLQPGSILTV